MMAQERCFKLTIDAREKYLRALITEGGSVRIDTLDLGDVMCEYQDGSAWILERKTIHDNRRTNSHCTTCSSLSLSLSLSIYLSLSFSPGILPVRCEQDLTVSIKDGRWAEQKARLLCSGLTVFYILEGDFRNTDVLPYAAVVGAYANASLLEGVKVFRTLNIEETKFLIFTLAKKCQATSNTPTRALVSKRKKADSLENIWIRQLASVPTISESIAVAILQHFGTMSQLREALQDPRNFPPVPLSRGACLGKARIEKLRVVLLQ